MEKDIIINQSVAILCDGNNIERSIQAERERSTMLNFDTIIPRLLNGRGLNRLIYFREGLQISSKFAERLHQKYYGSVIPCHKSADIPLSIKATQLASKVDTIIIMSGDSDYVELVRHLKAEGVRVEIAAVKRTSARILLEEADYFHEITEEDIFNYTGRQQYRRSDNKQHHSRPQQKRIKQTIPNEKIIVQGDPKPTTLPLIGEAQKRVVNEIKSKKLSLPTTTKKESTTKNPVRKTSTTKNTSKQTTKTTKKHQPIKTEEKNKTVKKEPVKKESVKKVEKKISLVDKIKKAVTAKTTNKKKNAEKKQNTEKKKNPEKKLKTTTKSTTKKAVTKKETKKE